MTSIPITEYTIKWIHKASVATAPKKHTTNFL